MRGMKERATQFGGELELTSGEEGVTVKAIMPVGNYSMAELADLGMDPSPTKLGPIKRTRGGWQNKSIAESVGDLKDSCQKTIERTSMAIGYAT